MDIMRGKYKVNEPEYIRKQLRGMTGVERQKLLTMDFEEIWHQLWGSDTECSQRYAHDRVISKQKLAELRGGIEGSDGTKYTLADLLRQEPVIYDTPEWGFPKGRRDPYETDLQCAFRELEEETGIIVKGMNFTSTNNSQYLIPIGVFDKPYRDPRNKNCISYAFAVAVDEMPEAIAGDDATECEWIDFNKFGETNVELAFDHEDIIKSALNFLQ
jgi:ADP-ribose pyrophosphatase YjhB (NUDIX family)